ncbi:MAG: ATP synthase F1 subunit epsilon [Acidobacteria bacterium]|nr:MAG: ATP synthase F1 subunit epsilon [Acidobacteriota bacterium]REK01218.1 MAG: ATP synthase F1 subunit epsilon [Acidobacteriota bacterium]REK14174.1 MAG: ATP synthase F1 subunit epsilon [Acidobacteriota bacterium]REK44889.1 MAG: ATP synthase F1 subunit epsilon [Acidobacteriota bacterium]
MINLEIVTPERMVVSEAVEMVTVPTAMGEIGILDNHAPLISTLKPGILKYTVNGSTEEMVVSGGFIEISGDKVSILADIAESKDEINVDEARTEQSEAQKVLGEWKGTEEEFEIELERLQKAQARLDLGMTR